MSDFKIIANRVIPQAIEETSTTQLLPLGTRVTAVDKASTAYGEGEFIYLKGVASTVLGSFATISADDFSTALLVANAIGDVGTSMSINPASSFGWYQIAGKGVGKAKASFADDANVYGTSTAGSIDDTIVAGDRVQRCKGASAVDTPSTGLAEFEMFYPFTNNALAD